MPEPERVTESDLFPSPFNPWILRRPMASGFGFKLSVRLEMVEPPSSVRFRTLRSMVPAASVPLVDALMDDAS